MLTGHRRIRTSKGATVDEVICALCIKACYDTSWVLQAKKPYSGTYERNVHTLPQLKEAHAEGLQIFEAKNPMGLGVYAETIVKGVALCATHALFVVQSLDVSTL